eukprot:96320-Chlamydomonas_euryale.AAC.5
MRPAAGISASGAGALHRCGGRAVAPQAQPRQPGRHQLRTWPCGVPPLPGRPGRTPMHTTCAMGAAELADAIAVSVSTSAAVLAALPAAAQPQDATDVAAAFAGGSGGAAMSVASAATAAAPSVQAAFGLSDAASVGAVAAQLSAAAAAATAAAPTPLQPAVTTLVGDVEGVLSLSPGVDSVLRLAVRARMSRDRIRRC